MTALYIIFGLIILVLLAAVIYYNRFVKMENRTDEAWADIDVQLKRRYDLIPNLVNTVKGYAAHERETFEEVTNARTQAMQAGNVAQKGEAENMLTGALQHLFAVAESYPELKANENFRDLQRELVDTENKIQAARRFYNANVRDLSIVLEQFPGSIIAGMFHFKQHEFFELAAGDEAAREPVEVKF